jgi:dephospho-CoA kinase
MPARLRPGRWAVHTRPVTSKPISQRWDARTYTGVGPHPADPRAAEVAATLMTLIGAARPGITADHVGSTAVPGLIGKNVVDLQITADPADVPAITAMLLGLGFARQRGRDPWPPERPMLEGTFGCRGGVFLIHCHVVPATDPDARQMIEFRDLLRADPRAREAYAADKQRITAGISDSLDYTHAKTPLIRRLLGGLRAADTSPSGPGNLPARTDSD